MKNTLALVTALVISSSGMATAFQYNGTTLHYQTCVAEIHPDFGYGFRGTYLSPSLRKISIFFPSGDYSTCPF